MWQWSIKKAEHQITDAFESWCWRRLLGVPWTASRSNWSILKEINPEYSLEGLMLRLKLQYFAHLMWKANSWERSWCLERLKERSKVGDKWVGWLASPTWLTWIWASSGRHWRIGKPSVPQSQRVGLDLLTEKQQQIPLKISTWSFKYIFFLPYVTRKIDIFQLMPLNKLTPDFWDSL